MDPRGVRKANTLQREVPEGTGSLGRGGYRITEEAECFGVPAKPRQNKAKHSRFRNIYLFFISKKFNTDRKMQICPFMHFGSYNFFTVLSPHRAVSP